MPRHRDSHVLLFLSIRTSAQDRQTVMEPHNWTHPLVFSMKQCEPRSTLTSSEARKSVMSPFLPAEKLRPRRSKNPWRDYHIVCGACGNSGSDPVGVVGKNGPGPYECKRSGGDHRPSAGLKPIMDANGKQIAWQRVSNLTERCYCCGPHKLPR